jgi:hypothetical protein
MHSNRGQTCSARNSRMSQLARRLSALAGRPSAGRPAAASHRLSSPLGTPARPGWGVRRASLDPGSWACHSPACTRRTSPLACRQIQSCLVWKRSHTRRLRWRGRPALRRGVRAAPRARLCAATQNAAATAHHPAVRSGTLSARRDSRPKRCDGRRCRGVRDEALDQVRVSSRPCWTQFRLHREGVVVAAFERLCGDRGELDPLPSQTPVFVLGEGEQRLQQPFLLLAGSGDRGCVLTVPAAERPLAGTPAVPPSSRDCWG